MKKIKILTDSCSDLDKKIRTDYDIDYFKMKIVFKGKEYPASLDWDEGVSYDEFFSWMKEGNRVTTSQVTVGEFREVFGKYTQDYDIIYISGAAAQSASVKTGEVVAKDIMNEDPSIRIEVIDSLNSTCGLGMMTLDAAKMVKNGKSFDEIVSTIKKERNSYNEFATVGSLEWLRRCGRVKASSAFFGNLFGVKPILIADANGAQTPIKKVKGRSKSLEEIVSLLSDSIDQDSDIFVLDGDNSEEDLQTVLNYVNEKIPNRKIYVEKIGPILGASCGPETIGVYGKGKEVVYKVEV